LLPFFLFFKKIARNGQEIGGFCITYTIWTTSHSFNQKKFIYFTGINQADADYDINTTKYFRAKRHSCLMSKDSAFTIERARQKRG
jgi:hypothetical protein